MPNPCIRVVPDAAAALPITGGQNEVHEPLQFDFVGVSIANQYSVLPAAFVSTVPLLVLCVMIVTVEALEPVPCGDVAALELDPLVAGVDVLVEGEPELPHAASRAAPPTTIGAAHHRLRMVLSPFLVVC